MSDSATPWTVACQASLSMDFSGKKTTGVGLPFLSPGDLPDSGIEPVSLPLQADSLQLSQQGSPGSSLRVRIYSTPGTSVSMSAAISAANTSGPLTPISGQNPANSHLTRHLLTSSSF